MQRFQQTEFNRKPCNCRQRHCRQRPNTWRAALLTVAPRLSMLEINKYSLPCRISADSTPDLTSARYTSPWPGGYLRSAWHNQARLQCLMDTKTAMPKGNRHSDRGRMASQSNHIQQAVSNHNTGLVACLSLPLPLPAVARTTCSAFHAKTLWWATVYSGRRQRTGSTTD